MRRCLILGCFVTLAMIFGTRGMQIDCDFKVESLVDGDVYSCKAIKLMVTKEDDAIELISGDHMPGKSNGDVRVLHVEDQVVNFFPADIDNFFPNLKGLKIIRSELKSLTPDNLKFLPDLKYVDFSDNKIESLDAGLFTFNSRLLEIKFDSNKIKNVDSEIFDTLEDLNSVSMKNNECIDGSWSSKDEIAAMKDELQACSSNTVIKTIKKYFSSVPSLDGQSNGDQVEHTRSNDISKVTKYFFKIEDNAEVTCNPAKVFWTFSAGELNTCTIDTQTISHADFKINLSSESSGDEVQALSFNDNNNLRYLPKNIGEVFPGIVELAAKHTYLESISENNFQGLTQLKKMSLSNNDLTVIENGAFAGLGELEELDLSEGNIQFIEAGAFSGLKSLKTLQIGGNKLRFLPANLFEGLTELRNLSIEHNHLVHLDENLFSTNTKLVNMWFNGNKIKVLNPKVFTGLFRLAYVDLQDNECVDGIFETSTLPDMEKVLEKNCSSSYVVHQTFKKFGEGDGAVRTSKTESKHYEDGEEEEEIEEEEVSRIVTYRRRKKPKGLYTEDTFEIEATGEMTGSEGGDEKTAENVAEIPKIPESIDEEVKASETADSKAFESPKSFCKTEDVRWRFSGLNLPTCIVENLKIDSKDYKITDPIDTTAIQGLIIVNNKNLKFLPENLPENFKGIVEFSAQNSSLVLLSRKNFEGLEKLKTLNLANNNIKFIEPDTFDDLRNLEELDLSGNQMEYIDENVFLKLKSLKTLRLDGNKLHFIHAKLFRNLRNLVNVTISGNQLTTLDDFIFKTNQKLQNIWIDDNKIKTLSPKLFSGKKQLELVDLEDNKCIDAVYTKAEFDKMKEEVQTKCGTPYVLKHGKKSKKTTPKKKKKEKVKNEKPVNEYDDLKEVLCEYEDVFWPSLNQTLFTCVVSSDQVVDGPGYTITINGHFALPFVDGETVQALSFANSKNIKFLPENIYEAFPNLVAMSVPENSLESVTKSSFKNLSKLKTLNLAGNKLKSIDIDAFDDLMSLEELNIDDNEFETIEETIFIRTKKIRRLKMSGNRITSFDPEVFEVLTELEEVTMELEDPSQVNGEWFKSNSDLKIISLNGKLVDKQLKEIDATKEPEEYSEDFSANNQPKATMKAPEVDLKPDADSKHHETDEFVEETSCDFKETTAFDGSTMFTCFINGHDTSGNYDIVIKETPDLKRVKRIVFDNNKKLKNLPENIAQLFPEVVEISAANTNLIGVNKKDLEGLANLKFLNLSRNNIKHLDPNTLDDLESLENVDLSNNDMEFIEETLFYRPKNLNSVDLSSNKLHYVHPKTFRHLENLETVNLNTNLLSVIEPFTFKLNRKLKIVDLSGNTIESLNPKIVDNAKELRTINLKGNKCIDKLFDPTEFEEMKKLIKKNCKAKAVKDDFEEVFCEFNAYDNTCTIEDKIIETANYTIKVESDDPSEDVKTLVFKGPGVKFLPLYVSHSFPNVESFETIDVDLNVVSRRNFENLPKLKSLTLTDVKSVEPHAFDDLTSLESLTLDTDADDLDEDLFYENSILNILRLTGRQVKSISPKLLEKFTLLEDIDVMIDPKSDFDFYDIKSTVYQNNPRLKRFYVNGEVVYEDSHVELAVEPTTTIEPEVEEEKTTQKNIESTTENVLQRFYANEATTTARSNRRKPSRPSTMPRTTRRRTHARPGRVQSTSTTTETPITNGVTCSLGYSDFPTSNKTLITCDLGTQTIEDSDAVIQPNPYSSHIEGLRIDNNNKIKFLPENIAKALPNLVEISATNSSIESIFKDDFNDLKNLKALDLSGNKIQSIEPETFADLYSLEELDLSDNEIDYIDDTAFPNLKNLRTLDLKGNRISFLHPNIFENLTELRKVYLTGNNLPKDFDEREFFKKNPKVTTDRPRTDPDDRRTFEDRRPTTPRTTKVPQTFEKRRTPRPSTNQDKVDFDNLSNDVPCNYGETYWYFSDSNLYTCTLESSIDDPSSTIKPTSRNSRVKGLNFIDNKNVQYLPKDLAEKLPNLIAISGFNSNLNSIPSETFKDLTKVKYLNLAKNNLKLIEPNTFQALESLEELDLSDNQIENFDESTFENLPHLTTLYLGGNSMSRLPAKIFHNLPNLRNLSLENNKIEKVDPSLFETNRNLETLWLNGNKIKNLSPRTFNGLTNLEYVDLQGNDCIDQYFDGTGIVRMRNEINRRCREQSLVIKPTTFRPDTKPSIPRTENKPEVTCIFEYVDWPGADSNLFTCIIENQAILYPNYTIKASPYADSTQGLKVVGKSVRQLPTNIASLFPKLSHVSVTNTMIDNVDPKTFADLHNLKNLELTDNNFYRSFDPNAFKDVASLEVLDLSRNRIPRIPDKAFPENIKSLNLASNKIGRIEPQTFENLHELTEIHLENNNLKKIPKNIFKDNKKLEKIILTGNQISKIDPATFNDLPRLTTVDLIENSCITGYFNQASFEAMKNEITRKCHESDGHEVDSVYRPNVDHDKTSGGPVEPSINRERPSITSDRPTSDSQTRVDPNETIEFESPKQISCDFGDSYSSISNSHVQTCNVNGQTIRETGVTFEAVPQNKRVKRLIFNDNRNVEFLPENIGESFPELFEIEVVNSSLNNLKPESFKRLPNLKSLDLAGNDLEFVHPAVFDDLTSLEHLDLSRNDINFFGHQNLENLQNLDLGNNEITFLSSKTFSKLPSLKSISLENNKLTGIVDEFHQNPLLEDVDLSRNLISSISTQAFDPLRRLTRLNLQENKCIDRLFNDPDSQSIQQQISQAVQQTCQQQDNILISFNTCTREKEICQRRLSLRSDNAKMDKIKKENVKLRAILKRYEFKITQLTGQHKKLRTAVNYEKNLAASLKQHSKELQAEIDYLKQKQTTCSSTDESFIKLQCDFTTATDGDYTCNSKNLKILKENSTIESAIGDHSLGKRNSDVTSLVVVDQTLKFLPDGLSEAFPGLQKLSIENSQLKKIDRNELKGLNDLITLVVRGNNIILIEPGSFDFNRKIQLLDLSGNHIHELPFQIFTNLNQLNMLNLDNNKLRTLSDDIIPAENQISDITLQSNELDSIDPRIFKKLRNAKKIDLRKNNCIDKLYESNDGSNKDDLMLLVGEVTMQCSTGDDNFCIGKQIV